MKVTSNAYFIFVTQYDTKSKPGHFKWPLESPHTLNISTSLHWFQVTQNNKNSSLQYTRKGDHSKQISKQYYSILSLHFTSTSINLKDRMRNEELWRRSGIEDAAKAARRQ
jgi:hypothetical protein